MSCGFLQRHPLRCKDENNGCLAQVTDVFDEKSERPGDWEKHHRNKGCCHAQLLLPFSLSHPLFVSSSLGSLTICEVGMADCRADDRMPSMTSFLSSYHPLHLNTKVNLHIKRYVHASTFGRSHLRSCRRSNCFINVVHHGVAVCVDPRGKTIFSDGCFAQSCTPFQELPVSVCKGIRNFSFSLPGVFPPTPSPKKLLWIPGVQKCVNCGGQFNNLRNTNMDPLASFVTGLFEQLHNSCGFECTVAEFTKCDTCTAFLKCGCCDN